LSGFFLYAAAFVGVLGALVVVHEFGHYAVARLCGVKVLRFSIGFGRVVWSRAVGPDRTEWSVSLIPLGGYVKMLDEREGEVPSAELGRAFNRQSLARRSAIVVAGPLANFVLAILLYWAVFVGGSSELLPILGQPPVDSPAAVAGVSNGEKVRRVDGQETATWTDFRWLLLQKAVDGGAVDIETINERGEVAFRRLPLAAAAGDGWEGDALERLGIVFFRPNVPAVLGQVVAGGAGDLAGLRSGDRIVAIEGREIAYWPDLVAVVSVSAGKTLDFVVERGEQPLRLQVVPRAASEQGRSVGRIGVAVADSPDLHREIRTVVRYGPMVGGLKAVGETWEKTAFTVRMVGKMFLGEVSLKTLSGPVTIADYAGQSARLGLEYYLRFMALLSISLGVLNLLPIPVLDGGHLMYHILEAIKGRPLSERAMEIGQRVGVSILFILMAFAFFNDLNRLFAG